ncbi:hypothetical protein [Streptomyces hawaiiensis]|uniref:hypothetical protein n=1 Tax=Streptomyces hawaiiensis TaxID=67305 RepID=UPI003648D2CD
MCAEIDLVKNYAGRWQAKDHSGRTAVVDLDAALQPAKATDTAGKTTAHAYDSPRRLTKVTPRRHRHPVH